MQNSEQPTQTTEYGKRWRGQWSRCCCSACHRDLHPYDSMLICYIPPVDKLAVLCIKCSQNLYIEEAIQKASK